MGRRALLQGIFPTQGSNSSLLHLLLCQAGSLPPAPPGLGFAKGINKDLEFTEQENLGSKTRSERSSMRTQAPCVYAHARVRMCARMCVKALKSSGQSRWTFSLNQILKDHGWFFSETVIHGSL